MQKFFIEHPPVDGYCRVIGADAAHIRLSLRARIGENIIVCDGHKTDYQCVIERVSREGVLLRVIETFDDSGEPNVAVTVYQCLPKGGKMDVIVEKCVELGAVKIVPVISEHSIPRLDEKVMRSRLFRYNKIAREAAVQSGRGTVPEIGDFIKISDLYDKIAAYDAFFFMYEGGGTPLKNVFNINDKNIACVIGPEGGFSQSEAEKICDRGAHRVTMGSRILRTETAAMCFLSVVMYEYGNFV